MLFLVNLGGMTHVKYLRKVYNIKYLGGTIPNSVLERDMGILTLLNPIPFLGGIFRVGDTQ
jgi:hypothetical protein